MMTSSLSLTTTEGRDKADKFEDELKKLPQIPVGVHHCVNGGIYTRTGLIPEDTAFVGAVHKKDHINVVIGDVTISTDDGPVRLTGHHVIKGAKGSKRVAYAHAPTIWTTIFHTELTDIREIEAECAESPEFLQTQKIEGIELCS